MHHPAHDIPEPKSRTCCSGFPASAPWPSLGSWPTGFTAGGATCQSGSASLRHHRLPLGLWCLGGLLTDAFAHISGVVDDTFFTPWHAIWYSGATAYGFLHHVRHSSRGRRARIVRHVQGPQ